MKKVYFIAMMFAAISLQAQTYFFDDFESNSLDGYTLFNLDQLVPDDPDLINMADSAWTIKTITSQGWTHGLSAFSVSWYVNDAGPSDDWLITPAITVGEAAVLSWNAMAITSSGSFRDQYQVFVATAATLEAFSEAAPIFDTGSVGELATPQSRSINLSELGYTNQTIYIAFRNWTQPFTSGSPGGNGNGGNELCIDNIRVEGVSSIANRTQNTGQVNVYPNPAGGDFVNISIELLESDAINVRLIDINGKEVFTTNMGTLVTGTHLIQPGIDALPTGKYLIQITGTKTYLVKELIKN